MSRSLRPVDLLPAAGDLFQRLFRIDFGRYQGDPQRRPGKDRLMFALVRRAQGQDRVLDAAMQQRLLQRLLQLLDRLRRQLEAGQAGPLFQPVPSGSGRRRSGRR